MSITRAGATILLTGQVLSEAAKSRISNTLAFSGGNELRRLVNELRVVDEIDLGGRERDARLKASVESLLAESNPSFTGKVQAVVENATVYLLGQVSREEGGQAAELVSRLAGVESVRTVFDYVD